MVSMDAHDGSTLRDRFSMDSGAAAGGGAHAAAQRRMLDPGWEEDAHFQGGGEGSVSASESGWLLEEDDTEDGDQVRLSLDLLHGDGFAVVETEMLRLCFLLDPTSEEVRQRCFILSEAPLHQKTCSTLLFSPRYSHRVCRSSRRTCRLRRWRPWSSC